MDISFSAIDAGVILFFQIFEQLFGEGGLGMARGQFEKLLEVSNGVLHFVPVSYTHLTLPTKRIV